MVIYEKENSEFRQVGQVCICSQRYLEASSKANAEEREFVAEIEQFFDQASLAYHFWYDDPQQADFHEVAFEAERDARGCKPSYIEMWYPANGIDIRVIKECASSFYRKYRANISVEVAWKAFVAVEDAMKSYLKFIEHLNRMNADGHGVEFSEDVIKNLCGRWETTENEVSKILFRSFHNNL